MTVYTKLEIDGTEYFADNKMTVNKVIGLYNSTCTFSADFKNDSGDFSDTFALNDEVNVWADQDNLIMPSASPVSQWKMNDNLATTAVIDSIGLQNGVMEDNTGDKTVTGKINTALNFENTSISGDEYITISDNDTYSITNTGELSICFWAKGTKPASSYSHLLGKSNGGQHEWAFRLSSSGNVNGIFWALSGTPEYSTTSSGGWEDEVWTHWAVTAKDGEIKLYKNKLLVSTNTDLNISNLANGTEDVVLGTRGADEGVKGFNGSLDDVRIYSTLLSASDISAIYNDGNGTEKNIDDQKIFSGVIENIDFSGIGNSEILKISGRDFGAILMDTIVEPRVFKNTEVSEIVTSIMSQNISSSLISVNNVNVTTSTPDKITFQNKSVFDVIKELAEYAGFYFYVDIDNDLHFEEKNSTSSGLTFDNTNITASSFKTTDDDIFNKVTVYGDRILSGHEQYLPANGGSVFSLDYQPHNLGVSISGTTNVIQQPGGVLNIDEPERENVKWLVDFQAQRFVMASGTVAGDNIPTSGTDIIFAQYQKNTPIISVKSDAESQIAYGLKDKVIADKKIKDPEEATVKASSFLAEHKDPVVQGNIDVNGVIDVTPGNTAVVNIPFHDIDNQTYTIQSAIYNFNKSNNLSDNVLRVSLNKKIIDFTDTTKDILLRLKQTEMSQVDAGIVTLQVDSASVGVSSPWYASSRSIGSAFYFHTPGHNILNSNTSLLGDVRAGSVVASGGF